MSRFLLIIGLVFLSFPGEGTAQGLRFSGDVSLSTNSVNDQHGIARVDAILSLGLFRLAERPLTAELGTFAYFMRGDRPHETYAALAYDDRFRLGIMKPAYDLVLPSVFAFTAPSVAETRAEYAKARTTTEAMRFNSVPIGASYTEDTGNILWGISIHDADDGDFRSASGALEWRDEPWTWAVAMEGVWDRQNEFQGLNTKLGGRWSAENWAFGLAWLHPDANARPDALAFEASYDVSQYLTVMAFGEITDAGHDNAYGIAAKHQIAPDTDMVFSATDGADNTEVHMTFTRRY